MPIDDLEAMMDVICGAIRRDDSCEYAAVFARNASYGNEIAAIVNAIVAAVRSQSCIRETASVASRARCDPAIDIVHHAPEIVLLQQSNLGLASSSHRRDQNLRIAPAQADAALFAKINLILPQGKLSVELNILAT